MKKEHIQLANFTKWKIKRIKENVQKLRRKLNVQIKVVMTMLAIHLIRKRNKEFQKIEHYHKFP